MKSTTLVADALHQLPNFATLEKYLEQNIDELIETNFTFSFPSSQQELEAFHLTTLDTIRNSAPINTETQEREELHVLLDAGRRAIHKISQEGAEADLEQQEAEGLEAITLVVGRPTICIQNGSFLRPPCGWEILEQVRLDIEMACQSVGRIEIIGHDLLDWVGTGFLVAEDVVMTNRHVAEVFCQQETYSQWIFTPYITSCIDYIKEMDSSDSATFAFLDVIGMHEVCDLALFKVASISEQGRSAPHPLILSSQKPHAIQNRDVYIIGHPSWDGFQDEPKIIARIFSGVHGIKRLQPGKLIAAFEHDYLLTHDCSTLTGNSGSCIVDIETNRVIGLHTSGRPRQVNRGIPLWTLRSDPLLNRANVWFE